MVWGEVGLEGEGGLLAEVVKQSMMWCGFTPFMCSAHIKLRMKGVVGVSLVSQK